MRKHWFIVWLIMAALITVTGFFCYAIVEKAEMAKGKAHSPLPYICFIIVGLLGYVGWLPYPQKTIGKLWLSAYACVFGVIAILKGINLYIFSLSPPIRFFIYKTVIFFVSPLPFLACLLLIRQFSKKKGYKW